MFRCAMNDHTGQIKLVCRKTEDFFVLWQEHKLDYRYQLGVEGQKECVLEK